MANRTLVSMWTGTSYGLGITDGTPDGTVLLKDNLGQNLTAFTELADGRVIFASGTLITPGDIWYDYELWVTNGTPAGTLRVTDVPLGEGLASFNPLTTLAHGRALFATDDGTNGRELWVTDGTAAGTMLVKDIYPGAADSVPSILAPLSDGRALLAADDAAAGRELWITDGTAAGTVLLKDINPGSGWGAPSFFATLGDGRVLLRATDGGTVPDLWITDGTTAGTVLLKDSLAASSNNPGEQGYAELADGRLIFGGTDGTSAGVWTTDGSGDGTVLLKAGFQSVTRVMALDDGRIVFVGETRDTGRELWVTDGTTAGTALLKDIKPGSGNGITGELLQMADGRVLFQASDGVTGPELWITDGTPNGTVLVKDINPATDTNINGSSPNEFFALGDGRVLFEAHDLVYGIEAWITDGTAEGTFRLADTDPGMRPNNTGDYRLLDDGTALFTAYYYKEGQKLWMTDGTPEGTVRLPGFFDPAGVSYLGPHVRLPDQTPVLVAALADQGATEGRSFSVVLPAGSFADPDPDDTLTLSTSLASSNSLPAWLTFDAATGTFSGTPGAGDVGPLAVQVTATDQHGRAISGEFLIQVGDDVQGSTAGETLTGTAGPDAIHGGGGKDRLLGGDGADTLEGGTGPDRLDGGGGADVLIGGAGADNVTGGSGADRFSFLDKRESKPGAADTILDFSPAEGDRIDLSAIDADRRTAGHQGFAFLGAAPFSGHAGELRYEVIGADSHVRADINGDGVADMEIIVTGVTTLAAADFVL